jgi:excisionase family DNA binding protein
METTHSMSATVLTPLYCSVNDACVRWNCSRGHLYELLAADKIRAVKLGLRTKVEVASGDAFFASLPPAKIKPRKPRGSKAAASTQGAPR